MTKTPGSASTSAARPEGAKPAVCVFGAASDRIDEHYVRATEQLGRALAQNGYDLVFGGGAGGLMGACARGVVAAGGSVTGVTPEVIDEEQERFESMRFIKTDTLAERKELMESLSDAFVTVPGGLGTLDELFDVAAKNAVHEMRKPLLVLDTDGFYDGLVALLENLTRGGFVAQRPTDYLMVCATPAEVVAALNDALRRRG